MTALEPKKGHNGGYSTDACDPVMVKALARRLIRPLRERAQLLGYALTTHGSQQRDIDLVAIPWTEKAVPAEELALALRGLLDKLYGVKLEAGPNTLYPKPHGRQCWSFWIQPWTYVDLSVMPRGET